MNGFENRRLVLVSNAEPYAHSRKGEEIELEKLAGGLTSAMDPLMQSFGGVWIAWGREAADFEVLDSEGKVGVPDEDGYDLKRIRLSKEEVEGFYLGFSNKILWPICHSLPQKSVLDDYPTSEKYWEKYREVNRRYADAVLDEFAEDDLVWVHDYHLTLVPKMIREERPEADIAVFWHIPWPPWEMFGSLPWSKQIMEGLLASDFVGFHIPLYKNNFMTCAEMSKNRVDRERSLIATNTGETKVSPLPLGIDYDLFNSMKEKEEVKDKTQYLREEISTEKIIISVDRLDYTKGIPQRLRAYELFLEENPEFLKKVTLVQRVPPSRRTVSEYQSILNQIHRIVGEINGNLSKADWVPIRSYHRFLPNLEQLAPYYLIADVALVTPLVDGMNLVSKEYIATTEDGVLILSQFAGASQQLGEAISVNPHNTEQTAQAIKKALTMPKKERKNRLKKLKERIEEKDLQWWRRKFLNEWRDQTNAPQKH
ncbi:alpha,alpha-trehalose-phosphate synthase [candidate division MSBL1 archaeon SCGC-AAA259I09]|uniref:Alpha,alpha-trehalose-phosphate synthase n=2 Tax=candidate division MSBL1 TaxID=215777 RepID=A0A133UTZ8_9EURY|nr:alpha,alpha-trehalose-phosphate synthase [candidate division MSBL1 archaeon SCGC-AAA259D14]KXA97627.1 alpha,alpha-trehalose-phosphate synthase [candidate division MSBL1 archaeon SCGC-AAA259I09]